MSNQGSDDNIDITTDEEGMQDSNDQDQADQQKQDSADASQAGNESGEMTLEQELEAARTEARQARDDLLRVQAEMQNLRRRTEQDVEKAHKYGQERFANELLSVVDNLERALEAARDHEDERVKAIYDGVNLTLKSFQDMFNKFNIKAIDPLGEPFDPQLHQAMSTQENGDVEPNTVIAVMQKGYSLHDRVIRPAMVVVSKAPANAG